MIFSLHLQYPRSRFNTHLSLTMSSSAGQLSLHVCLLSCLQQSSGHWKGKKVVHLGYSLLDSLGHSPSCLPWDYCSSSLQVSDLILLTLLKILTLTSLIAFTGLTHLFFSYSELICCDIHKTLSIKIPELNKTFALKKQFTTMSAFGSKLKPLWSFVFSN